ncbi:MAG: NAD(P)H-dependent oxidoreductase [Patescibacteria group bacterium]
MVDISFLKALFLQKGTREAKKNSNSDILIISSNYNPKTSIGCKVVELSLKELKKTKSFNYELINLYDYNIPFYRFNLKTPISYQKLINKFNKYSNYLFIFPVWFSNVPAVFKNFIDWSGSWGMKKNLNGKFEGVLDNKKAIVIATCWDKRSEYIKKLEKTIDFQIHEDVFSNYNIDYFGDLIISDAHRFDDKLLKKYSQKVKKLVASMLV